MFRYSCILLSALFLCFLLLYCIYFPIKLFPQSPLIYIVYNSVITCCSVLSFHFLRVRAKCISYVLFGFWSLLTLSSLKWLDSAVHSLERIFALNHPPLYYKLRCISIVEQFILHQSRVISMSMVQFGLCDSFLWCSHAAKKKLRLNYIWRFCTNQLIEQFNVSSFISFRSSDRLSVNASQFKCCGVQATSLTV